MPDAIPVFLLKSKSTGHDFYEEVFSDKKDGLQFEPIFVPVTEHKLKDTGLNKFREILYQKKIGMGNGFDYHGLIFTSQRAVEAFTQLIVESMNGDTEFCSDWSSLQEVPVYAVGPATTRALQAIPLVCPLDILGSDSGNGEKLAQFILDHHPIRCQNLEHKRPLLFIAGEQRRDIIPKVLMDPSHGSNSIPVTELEVYTTYTRDSFVQDFTNFLNLSKNKSLRWVVLFSPTGSDAMLRCLNILDPKTGKAREHNRHITKRIYVATIGQTTKDYLQKRFSFVPDVCAKRPTPDSVMEGIKQFISRENFNSGT